nr:class IIb bacteriocin, lactobin A/cerein 7B family [uncultured Carboxylicivirga sp.]
MKNLNDLGVQEMDAKELQKTDGGFLGIAVAALIGSGVAWAAANFVRDVIIKGEEYDPVNWN